MIRTPPEWPPKRLSDFPYVVVRLRCDLCHRAGAYRLARLAATFGPEMSLDDLMDRLALDCPWRRPPYMRQAGKYEAKCHARFPDIHTTHPRPPDLPPGMGGLRVIDGGRKPDAAADQPDDDPTQRRTARG